MKTFILLAEVARATFSSIQSCSYSTIPSIPGFYWTVSQLPVTESMPANELGLTHSFGDTYISKENKPWPEKPEHVFSN